MFKKLVAISLLAIGLAKAVDVDIKKLPWRSDKEHGQTGINKCTKKYGASSQDSLCQNAFINSVTDFCLWGPPQPNSAIGDVEADVVSWCVRKKYGAREIPAGTIAGVQFLRTPSFVQVTGVGDLTKINVKADDDGGELDPFGADNRGNPVGGLVFTNAFSPNKDTYQQIKAWNSFISSSEFCFRACVGDYKLQWCPHIYDVMGCQWNQPGRYDPGTFEDCFGTEGEWPGVYQGSTWYQGVSPTPGPQQPGKSSDCTTYTGLPYGADAEHPLGRRSLEKRSPKPKPTQAPTFDNTD